MNSLRTSANGLARLASEEGEVLHVYLDAAGVATIGVGHVLRPGEAFPEGITHAQAMALLAGDVGIAEHAVNTQVRVQLGQNAFDALVSFTYNVGGGALAQSSTLALVNRGALQEGAVALLLWDKRRDPNTCRVVGCGHSREHHALGAPHACAGVLLTPDGAAGPCACPGFQPGALVFDDGLYNRRCRERDLMLTEDVPSEAPTQPE